MDAASETVVGLARPACMLVLATWMAGCTGNVSGGGADAGDDGSMIHGSLVDGGVTTSVLQWYPGGGIEPRAQILVSTFSDEELLATSRDGQFDYDAQSSVQQVFSHGDEALKAQMRSDFSIYSATAMSPAHPACTAVASPNLDIWTYVKPYTTHQSAVLAWLNSNADLADFLPAKARSANGYRGDQQCPWGASSANIDQTFGYATFADTNSVAFYLDNRLNPWRWNAPLNTIHPVEQPSFALVTGPTDLATTEGILRSFAAGTGTAHMYMDYDIDLSIYDARADMGENTIADVTAVPELASTLFGVTSSFAQMFGVADGIDAYARQRYAPPTIQLSIIIIFREDGLAYLENDFMLASFNYNTTVPNATANQTINNYIFEGGSHDVISWYRLRVDALQLPGLTSGFPSNPIVLSGGDYSPIAFTANQYSNKLKGRIDLTNYYLVSRANQFFPGQATNVEATLGEHNGIQTAGIISEIHGPFVVNAKVNQFNITVQP
jgi:hypothetical protein